MIKLLKDFCADKINYGVISIFFCFCDIIIE